MQLLSVDEPWPGDLEQRKQLVVRDFYKRLYIRAVSLGHALLTGVPGTGKSWWIL
jgi:MoxR-like ATPase